MKIQDTWSANTHTPLTTPTYDASGEATHPGVYDAGTGQTWNGYRYWMVMTPYPNSDSTKENPSILASADGITWVVPAGLTNPIASPNPVQCSDPDIIVVSGTMYCFYRRKDGGNDFIWRIDSSDGVTWANDTLMITDDFGAALSPAVIEYGGEYQMYTINDTVDPSVIERRTAATITGAWASPEVLSATAPAGEFWHIDIINDSNMLYAIIDISDVYHKVYLGSSEDGGNTWTFMDSPLLIKGDVGDFDETSTYRATMARTTTGFDIWYPGYVVAGETTTWRIGKTNAISMDETQNLKHLYTVVANDTLSGINKTNALLIVQRPGIGESGQPAYINHRRTIDVNTILAEARFNTDYLTADQLKANLALMLEVDVGTITCTTTSPSYGGGTSTMHQLIHDETDQFNVIIFGGIGATWSESWSEVVGYL